MTYYSEQEVTEALSFAEAFIELAKGTADAEALARIRERVAGLKPLLVAAPSLLFLLEEAIVIWGAKIAASPESVSRDDLRDWLGEWLERVEEKVLPLLSDKSSARVHFYYPPLTGDAVE